MWGEALGQILSSCCCHWLRSKERLLHAAQGRILSSVGVSKRTVGRCVLPYMRDASDPVRGGGAKKGSRLWHGHLLKMAVLFLC